MQVPRTDAGEWLKRRINAAKAETGMSWAQIAEKVSRRDRKVSPSSLMSKHSRASFTALELIAILQALDVQALNLPAQRNSKGSQAR